MTCENTDEIHEPKKNINKFCAKCRTSPSTVFVRRAAFCRECFCNSVIHRFRSNIQKSKLIPDGSKVLLAFSGGPSSSALLHVIDDFHTGKSTEGSLRKVNKYEGFVVCNIDESALFPNMKSTIEEIQSHAQRYPFPYLSVPLQNLSSDLEETFASIKEPSAQEDFLRKLRIRLLVHVAKEQGCGVIFFGDNSTRIAIRSISDTAKGRGFSMDIDIGGETDWFDGVVVARPIRDVLSKEIGVYNYFQGVEHVSNKPLVANQSKSIDKLTEDFIVGLQRDFPSTINTVARTVAKIGGNRNKNTRRCQLCLGPIKEGSLEWSRIHTVSNLNAFDADVVDDSKCYSCRAFS